MPFSMDQAQSLADIRPAPVATAALLTDVVTAAVTTFTVIGVQSFKDLFALDKDDITTTVDGIMVVATDSGVGRWKRVCIPHQDWQKQPNWYFDASVGNDQYDGTAATNTGGLVGPLKTWGEYIRRTGQIVTVQTTFHVSTNPPTDKPIMDLKVRDGGSWKFVGGRTSLHTGTFTATTALNRATNVPWAVTDGAITDWTPYVGKLGVITGGARVGAIFVVVKRTAATVARISALATYPSDGSQVTLVTPTIGDPYMIFDVPAVTFTAFSTTGGELNYYNIFENLDVCGETALTQLCFSGNANCYITASSCIMRNAAFQGPFFTVQVSKLIGSYDTNCNAGHVLIHACAMMGATTVACGSGGTVSFDKDTIAQGVSLFTGYGGDIFVYNACAFDSSGSGATVFPYGIAELGIGSGVFYGSGNATAGVKVWGGGRCSWNTAPTITGVGGDFSLGGAYTAFAFDNALGVYSVAAKRALTWALLATSYAGGGFGNNAADPFSGAQMVKAV